MSTHEPQVNSHSRSYISFIFIRSDQSLSRVWLFATPWIAAHQASLPITNSWSSLRLMSIESVMPSSHLILCRPLLLLQCSRFLQQLNTVYSRWSIVDGQWCACCICTTPWFKHRWRYIQSFLDPCLDRVLHSAVDHSSLCYISKFSLVT